MLEIIKFDDDQSWLERRLQDITSTEVACLFNLSPYMTEFELYHQKKDGVVVRIEENERMKWGKRLEDSIALGAAEDKGWTVEKMDVYMSETDARIGSSFDYKITGQPDGDGIMEIKNVDGLQYARNWIDDGNGNIEAPEHIELQVQHQMEVADINWCVIVALVGGNTQKFIRRERDREIGAEIRKRVANFWKRIDEDRAPKPDYTHDAEFIIKKLRNEAEDGLVLEANDMLQDLLRQYNYANKQSAELKKVADKIKAEILDNIGKASRVTTPFGNLSSGMTKDSQGKLVTPDMVGTYIGARSGYRSFRFTEKKGE